MDNEVISKDQKPAKRRKVNQGKEKSESKSNQYFDRVTANGQNCLEGDPRCKTKTKFYVVTKETQVTENPATVCF